MSSRASDSSGMDNDAGQQKPAGWYEDSAGILRWWDGHSWTEKTQLAEKVPTVVEVENVTSSGGVRNLKRSLVTGWSIVAFFVPSITIAIMMTSIFSGDLSKYFLFLLIAAPIAVTVSLLFQGGIGIASTILLSRDPSLHRGWYVLSVANILIPASTLLTFS